MAFLSSGVDFDNFDGVVDATGATINTADGALTFNHTGTVTIGGAIDAGLGTISLLAGGNVVDAFSDPNTEDLTADSLSIRAAGVGTGTGVDNALDIQVANLEAQVDGEFDVRFSDDMTITEVVGVAGVAGGVLAGDRLEISSSGVIPGSLTVAAAVSTSGATSPIILDTDIDLAINDTVSSQSGTVDLTADGEVSFNATGAVSSVAGLVTVIADLDSAGGGGIDMAAGAVVNSGTGSIDLTATDDIVLSGLTSGDTVDVQSTGGSINDASDDGLVDISGTVVTLTAGDEVGGDLGGTFTDVALEVVSTSLDVSTTSVTADAAVIVVADQGGTELTDLDTVASAITVTSDSDLSVDNVTAGTATASAVTITADGSINDASDGTDTDISGTVVTLTAGDEVGGDLGGTFTDVALEVVSTSLDVSTTSVTADAAVIVVADQGGTELTDLDTVASAITVTSDKRPVGR